MLDENVVYSFLLNSVSHTPTKQKANGIWTFQLEESNPKTH